MAQAIFNYLSEGTDICAFSCGIYGDGSSQISVNADAVLKEIGIEFKHTSTPITKEAMDDADYIVGITANHARTLISMFPESENKIYAMPIDIPDPFGGNIEIYRQCRNQLSLCIKELIKTILGENNG